MSTPLTPASGSRPNTTSPLPFLTSPAASKLPFDQDSPPRLSRSALDMATAIQNNAANVPPIFTNRLLAHFLENGTSTATLSNRAFLPASDRKRESEKESKSPPLSEAYIELLQSVPDDVIDGTKKMMTEAVGSSTTQLPPDLLIAEALLFAALEPNADMLWGRMMATGTDRPNGTMAFRNLLSARAGVAERLPRVIDAAQKTGHIDLDLGVNPKSNELIPE